MNHVETYRPSKPERLFKPGQTVRWNPSPGAYSSASAQAHYAGQTAGVLRIVSDDEVMLLMAGGGAMLANTAYLEDA